MFQGGFEARKIGLHTANHARHAHMKVDLIVDTIDKAGPG